MASASPHRRVATPAILAVLCLAQFMLIVDVVVVNVALPTIRAGLDIPDARLAWTGIAYTLTFGSLLIVAGRAGDLFGRRRLFLGGLALFSLASLFAGAARVDWQLFGARALQGIGAAAVSPNALALLTASFEEGPARNRALGFWGAVGSGGAIAGQLIGGFLTDLAGWRAIFLINVPVGLAAIAVAARALPEGNAADRLRLDLAGGAFLAAGLAALTLALSRLAEGGFDAPVLLAAATTLALLLAFVARERRHPAPMLRFEFLREPGVRVGNAYLAISAASVGAALFFSTLYLQVTLDYSPFAVGAAIAPATLIVLAVSPLAGRLIAPLGVRRLLLGGAFLVVVGLLLLARIPSDGDYLTDILPGLACIALGSGLSFVPCFVAGTGGVRARDQGLASGLLNTSQELGAALGLALLASLATAVTRDAGTLLSGYRAGFLGAAALVGLAALLVALTRLHTDAKIHPAPQAAPSAPTTLASEEASCATA